MILHAALRASQLVVLMTSAGLLGCGAATTQPPASTSVAKPAPQPTVVQPAESAAADVAAEAPTTNSALSTPEAPNSAGSDDPQAIASLKKLGAAVDVGNDGRVWKVDFTRTNAQNADLDLLRSFDQLEILTLTGTRFLEV